MSYTKYIDKTGYSVEILSAHTHIILVGSVMMMIMGVALWFFPRAEKTDKKYNPDLILVVYWLMTISTLLRFIFQVIKGIHWSETFDYFIATTSALQVISMILFFYSIWGRIRPVGSKIREARGEKF
jgi:heme/copper-type cytochrome/quinol oxidase subunit 1